MSRQYNHEDRLNCDCGAVIAKSTHAHWCNSRFTWMNSYFCFRDLTFKWEFVTTWIDWDTRDTKQIIDESIKYDAQNG